MKRFLIGVGTVLLVTSVTAGCGRLGQRVDEHIERVGSELTGVPVRVERVKLKLARGSGEITGVTIANPEGYTAANAFEMQLLRVNLGLVASLGGDPLVLDELVIDSPVVNFEAGHDGRSNLKELSDNLERNRQRADEESAALETASEDEPGKPIRIAVRKLVIEGVTLNVRPVDGGERSGTLPSIELSDVGGDGGATPAGLGAVVLAAMAGEMLKQAVARELIEGAGNIRAALTAENLLAALGERLKMTPRQRDRAKPAVERIAAALRASVDAWVAQGFVDLDSLSAQLAPVVADVKMSLAEVLDAGQVQTLEGFLTRLGADASEVIRFALIERVAQRLDVTPEQLARLRPLLRENLVAVSALVRRFVNEPGASFEEFRSAYDDLSQKLRARLKQELDADQLRLLTMMHEELLSRIREVSFAAG